MDRFNEALSTELARMMVLRCMPGEHVPDPDHDDMDPLIKQMFNNQIADLA